MKVLSFLLLALMSQTIMAETLTVGKFASFSSKEDGSAVEVLAVKVVAIAETSGVSLALNGCNAGKVSTGEPGPYGTSYKPVDAVKVVTSEITSPSTVEIKNAAKAVQSIKESLKKKVPFYCKIESQLGVELSVRVLKTNRVASALLALYPTNKGLMVDTALGLQDLSKEVTIVELP